MMCACCVHVNFNLNFETVILMRTQEISQKCNEQVCACTEICTYKCTIYSISKMNNNSGTLIKSNRTKII